MNLTRIESNSNVNLFDSIRRQDENGQEYWSARELMVVMGYTRWENFETAIASATENLELAGDVVRKHFRSKVKKSKGRPSLDYELTRYGCYMTALSCDGRKPEVALAKKYFAIKTREAEVIIPKQNEEIETLKLKLQVLEAEKEVAQAQQKLLDTRHLIVTTCPEPVQQKILGYQVVKEIEKVEVIVDRNSGKEYDGVGITYITKSLGFKNNQQCWAWLEKVGYGKDSGKWQNELTAIHTPKLSRDDVQYLKDIFTDYRQGQQLFIGE